MKSKKPAKYFKDENPLKSLVIIIEMLGIMLVVLWVLVDSYIQLFLRLYDQPEWSVGTFLIGRLLSVIGLFYLVIFSILNQEFPIVKRIGMVLLTVGCVFTWVSYSFLIVASKRIDAVTILLHTRTEAMHVVGLVLLIISALKSPKLFTLILQSIGIALAAPWQLHHDLYSAPPILSTDAKSLIKLASVCLLLLAVVGQGFVIDKHVKLK